MKYATFGVTALLAGSLAQADYKCPVMPSASDAAALKYGLAIQGFLSDYYKSVPVNMTFFSTLPNNTLPQTDFLGNVMGLNQQAILGVNGLKELSAMVPSSMMPSCSYKYPPVSDAMSHLMNAYIIEATLCGAFIGLADYVQSPQAAFLMARLAAEHGIHASYIGSHMKPQVFMANSTSLTPAFTPEQVLMSGMGVGKLGQYLGGCVSAPPAPCGGTVNVGMLTANLTNESTTTSYMATPTMSMAPHSASSTQVSMFTGAASHERKGIGGAMGGAILAAAIFIL